VVRRTPFVQFFGPPTGYIVNYTPDHAVRFDLNGDPVEAFNRAYFTVFGGKTMSGEAFAKITGMMPQIRAE